MQTEFAEERRQLQPQHQQLIATMTGQIATLRAEVAAGKVADPSSSSARAATKKKGVEAELERRKRLTYVPQDLDNPFPSRPKNLDSKMPQLFAIYGDKSYDSLSKKSASLMKYEYVNNHDFLKYASQTVEGFEDFEPDDMYDRLVRLENSIHGVYTLLCNRFTVLQLRASLDGEGASKSDADSLRAKLKFVEDCVYQGTEGLVTHSLLKEYLDEFDKGKNKAVMYANMKHAALVETGNTRGGGRGVGGMCVAPRCPAPAPLGVGQKNRTIQQKVRSRRGAWRAAGANAEVLQWISRGAKMRWVRQPPPRFDHGVSLLDASPLQQIWPDKEIERALGTGAWKKPSRRQHMSRAFLVKKPGEN
eukprot:gene34030-biopygen4820